MIPTNLLFSGSTLIMLTPSSRMSYTCWTMAGCLSLYPPAATVVGSSEIGKALFSSCLSSKYSVISLTFQKHIIVEI